MLKAALHNHTNYIQKIETNFSPKELIDKAASMGFDVLCFSEHYALTKFGDYFPEYRKEPLASYTAFKGYAESKGILLLPAVEMRYREGEVLLVNFKGNVKDYPAIESLKNLPKDVFVAAPHPFFKGGMCLGKNLYKHIHLFDAIEYSHFYTSLCNLNRKAVIAAEMHNLPMLGTSDTHMLSQLGHTYTLIDAEKNERSVVNALKNGKFKLATKPLPLWLFVAVAVNSMYKISSGPFRILYRILAGKY
ncbi:MAG: PHP-associated domain-containing protein [Nanoarchaeota archaeon]|nr:PHP-associated domain-containing protein [Nanoarchaeota archaeon]